MVFVDFSHPYLRDCLRVYCAYHEQRLLDIADKLAARVARSAALESEAAAGEGRPPRPLAAVLDIDEVLLCNLHMNSYRAEDAEFHAVDFFSQPDGTPWPRFESSEPTGAHTTAGLPGAGPTSRLNPLYPGARRLLECLVALNVRIYFVTGRLESIRDETVENFAYVGVTDGAACLLPVACLATQLIMRPDADRRESVRPFKEESRRAIEATHRIIVNVGDQVSDLGYHGDEHVHCAHPFYWTK